MNRKYTCAADTTHIELPLNSPRLAEAQHSENSCKSLISEWLLGAFVGLGDDTPILYLGFIM